MLQRTSNEPSQTIDVCLAQPCHPTPSNTASSINPNGSRIKLLTTQDSHKEASQLPLLPSITPPIVSGSGEPLICDQFQEEKNKSLPSSGQRDDWAQLEHYSNSVQISNRHDEARKALDQGAASGSNSEHSVRQSEDCYHNKTMLAHKILGMIRDDDMEQFRSILRRSKPDLNVFINGQTALHYCLLLGRDVSWCKLLVLNGANPNLSNQDGWHPLHLAAFRGLKDSVHYLTSCNHPTTANSEATPISTDFDE